MGKGWEAEVRTRGWPYLARRRSSMRVMRAMLLFEEQMKEKRHSTGSCLRRGGSGDRDDQRHQVTWGKVAGQREA